MYNNYKWNSYRIVTASTSYKLHKVDLLIRSDSKTFESIGRFQPAIAISPGLEDARRPLLGNRQHQPSFLLLQPDQIGVSPSQSQLVAG